MPVNISINTNTVAIQENINHISVNDPNNPNIVDITQPVTNIVEVITAGPQGPMGPPGTGSIADTGSFATTGSNTFIGNQIITGSLNVIQGITGSLLGTASYVSGSVFTGTNPALTSSYALTASYLAGYVSPFPYTGSALVTGSLGVTGSVSILGSSTASGSILRVVGSGSTQPIFTVQGSQGELFSVTDSLSGSLFSVNDISGLPVLEVFSDNTTLVGSYQAPSLIATSKKVLTSSGAFTMYLIPTSSYDSAFFEYTARSGSNARAGQIIAIWSGNSVNYTEITTADFGSTAGLAFGVFITGSNMALTGSAPSTAWTIKTIVRSI